MITLLLLACTGDEKPTPGTPDSIFSPITATASPAMGTVLRATWTTTEPVVSQIRFGAGDYSGLTPLEAAASTTHEALILGVGPEEDVTLTPVAQTDAGEVEGEPVVVTTGPLPLETPGLELTGAPTEHFLTITLLGATTGPAIVNGEGEIVWFHPDDRGLDVYRARLSQDGQSVIYNAGSVSGDPADNSVLVKVSLDGATETEIPLPLLAHDFVELPDGTLTAIVVEYRDGPDGEPIRGDSLVEIAPDGTQTKVWDAWRCFDPALDVGTDAEIGWTFANALDYLPDTDRYALSLRNFSTILQIDRQSGECVWSLGSTSANITPSGRTFLNQHQFHFPDADTLVLFDNSGSADGSRALEYTLTETTAEAVWSYSSDPPIDTFVLGDVFRLEDGRTYVDFAVGGQVDLVEPDGTVDWRVSSPLGYAFGFMVPEPSLYRD